MVLCQGLTSKGNSCKSHARKGTKFCTSHTVKPSVSTSERLVLDIINNIRSYVNHNNENNPWNEGEGGAGWLDNEISLFNDLYIEYWDNSEEDDEQGFPEIEDLNSVPEIKKALQDQCLRYLTLLRNFTIKGGSFNSIATEIARDETRDKLDKVRKFLEDPALEDSSLDTLTQSIKAMKIDKEEKKKENKEDDKKEKENNKNKIKRKITK